VALRNKVNYRTLDDRRRRKFYIEIFKVIAVPSFIYSREIQMGYGMRN